MKKILFCMPASDFRAKPQQPPFGVLSMAAVLKEAGHIVELLDNSIKRLNTDRLKEYYRRSRPDVIGISVNVENRFAAKVMAQAAKDALVDVPVVFGGPFATLCYEDILKNWSCVDIVARGEAEYLIAEIVENVGRDSLFSLDGIAYRRNGQVIANGQKKIVEDLNALPDPAFELVDIAEYPSYLSQLRLDRAGIVDKSELSWASASLVFGRGCPFKCIFCNTHALAHSKHRIVTPRRAVSYIEWYYTQGVREFTFWDDDLTINKKWFFDFCDVIKEKGLKIIYKCMTSARFIDREIADRLYESGCRLVTMGIEHGSDRILGLMNKNLTQAQIEQALRLLSEKRIMVHGNFMINTPTETIDDIAESLKFYTDMQRKYSYQVSLPYPMKIYPGTPLENSLVQEGRITLIDWTKEYYCKRNLFLRSTPYVPIYENRKNEELISEIIGEMVSLRLGNILYEMLRENIRNIMQTKEFLLKDRLRYAGCLLRGIVSDRRRNVFMRGISGIAFTLCAVTAEIAKKVLKRLRFTAAGRTDSVRKTADSPSVIYISYSKLDLRTANSIQTHLTVKGLYRQNSGLEVCVPFLKSSQRKYSRFLPVKFIRYLSLKNTLCALGLKRFFPNYLSPLDQLSFAVEVSFYLLGKKLRGELDNTVLYVRDIPFVAVYNILFKRLLKNPVVLEIHSLEEDLPYLKDSAFIRPFSRFLDRNALSGAAKVAALSQHLKDELIARLSAPEDKITVIGHGFDANSFYPMDKSYCRSRLGVSEDDFVVLYAGLNFRFRNVDDIVRAFRMLEAENAKLMFLGGTTTDKDILLKLCTEEGLKSSDVLFFDKVPMEEVALYLNAADVIAMPEIASVQAPPIKLLEAMACGLPVICVDRPVLKEILKDDTALFIGQNDVRGLADALKYLYDTPSAGGEMSGKLLILARKYTYQRRVSAIMDVCRGVVGGRQYELKRKVGAFYDEFHLKRSRQVPSKMKAYWKELEGDVLEIGCGTLYPENDRITSYTVSDLSAEAVKKAAASGVAAVRCDAEDLPFADKVFDCVSCFDVLEHIPDPARAVREMARVSKGKVVVAGPNYIGSRKYRYHTNPVLRKLQFLPKSFDILAGAHKKVYNLSNPHLEFDDKWDKDADAVTAVNLYTVEKQLEDMGFDVVKIYINGTEKDNGPLSRYMGDFMFVVGLRRSQPGSDVFSQMSVRATAGTGQI